MISVNKVTVSYGKEKLALSNIDLEIVGSIAVLGEDGAGKTTLAKLISGQITPKSGDITVNGAAAKSAEAAEAIGYMPQTCHLSPTLSVADTLTFMAKLRRLDAAAVSQAIRKVKLNSAEANSPVGLLGALAKKKAMLASALLGTPKYLVMDQPLSGLEREEEEEMHDILFSLSEDYCIIYMTDSVNEAGSYGDNILLLSNGRSVGFGSTDDIMHPKTETAIYKGKARGDKDALRAVLENCEAIIKHKVSITSSGTALIELTAAATDGFREELTVLMSRADCKLLELKKSESPAERVIARLLEKQAEKEEKRRIKAEESAPPVKLTAEHLTLMRSDSSKEDTDASTVKNALDDENEKNRASLSGIGALLSLHRENPDSDDIETDAESTLFSSRDED